MTTAIKFCLQDREASTEPLHYKMCGLDDVYLMNGFKVHETAYGRGVAVENADELHRAIGMYLVRHRKVLSPKEFKFLRKSIKLTQEDLAECLGVTSQTIARYEKGQTEVPGPADRLTRMIYVIHLIPEPDRARVIKEIMDSVREMGEMDETIDDPVYFDSTSEGWSKVKPLQISSLAAAASMGEI